MKDQHTFFQKVWERRSKYASVIISVIVSFFFVFMGVYGATTVSTNLSTGGTLSVGGLSTLYGGFLTASSTATSTLMVSGVFSASSTLLAGGLATLYTGFISTASSTVVGTLIVAGAPLQASSTLLAGGLSTLTGFISTASSTAVSTLRVSDAFRASSTLQATGNAFLFGTLGVGATTTLNQEVGIVGDVLQDSTGTTSHIFSSSGTGKGGCIQLKTTDGNWVKLYATSTNSGYISWSAGGCQDAN